MDYILSDCINCGGIIVHKISSPFDRFGQPKVEIMDNRTELWSFGLSSANIWEKTQFGQKFGPEGYNRAVLSYVAEFSGGWQHWGQPVRVKGLWWNSLSTYSTYYFLIFIINNTTMWMGSKTTFTLDTDVKMR